MCPNTMVICPNNVWVGPKHFRSRKYVGEPFVAVVDWTTKGAVTPVMNLG